MRDAISTALKEAMKARDERRVSTMRMMNAAIKNRDIEVRVTGAGPVSDQELMQVFAKMIAQRQESATAFDKANRPELAAKEREEITIIESFLPRQLPESEIRDAVAVAVKETGAASVKDMGKVMAVLKERWLGQMDFAKAGAVAKELLK